MDWLQFFATIVGHLAWPVVLLIMAFALRKHLGSLADRLLELSFGGATAKFDRLLSRGAEIIAETPAPSEASLPLPKTTTIETEEDDPEWPLAGSCKIIASYGMVRAFLTEVAQQLGVLTGDGRTILRMMEKRDLIGPEALELYNTLREARNAVAHGALASASEVTEFNRQATFLAGQIHAGLVKLRQKTPLS